jgi:hypothetical protein
MAVLQWRHVRIVVDSIGEVRVWQPPSRVINVDSLDILQSGVQIEK